MLKKSYFILFFILISLISIVISPIGEIEDPIELPKYKVIEPILIKYYSPSSEIWKTSTGFKKVIYSGNVNVPYGNSFIPVEEFINISNDKGKIKISDLDGKECYIILNYTLTDSKVIAIPKINITKNRGSYYFTTNVGNAVDSMSYDLD